MKTTLRSSALGVATAALLLSLTACNPAMTGGGASGGAGAAAGEVCEDEKVSVGIVSSLSDSIILIADERGYFADQGLKVDLAKYDSAARMIPLLGADRLDVGAGAPSAGLYNAVSRDIDLKIVADKGELRKNYNYMPLLVRKDLVDSGEVKTAADLKGLKVAEPAEGTATSSTLGSILGAEGLEYADVSHEFIGFPDHVAAFANGSIDAALTTEPTATKILESGTAVRVGDSTDVYDGQQLAVVLYSSGFAEKRANVAQCFMNAYVHAAVDYSTAVEGGTWDGDGADEIVKIISDRVGLPADVITKTVPSYVNPTAALNVDSLIQDYEFFKSQGMIEADVDVESLIDNSFVDNATTAAE